MVENQVVVNTRGGSMVISKDASENIILVGPAEYAFSGKVDIWIKNILYLKVYFIYDLSWLTFKRNEFHRFDKNHRLKFMKVIQLFQ